MLTFSSVAMLSGLTLPKASLNCAVWTHPAMKKTREIARLAAQRNKNITRSSFEFVLQQSQLFMPIGVSPVLDML